MAGAYPGFISMMHAWGVLLLPPGRDASPSQGYPQQYVARTHLYIWAQLFDGRLAFNPGLNVTRVSFSLVQKLFLDNFSVILRASNHQFVHLLFKLSYLNSNFEVTLA